MTSGMDAGRVEAALRRVGQSMEPGVHVEVLLVGGAAGMVTGVFAPERTTMDCDIMVCSPPGCLSTLEAVADSVAAELGLSRGWLNSCVQLRLDTLPDGWAARRMLVGAYGPLMVWAASRLDLIAMKVFAGRPQDIDDLLAMRVRTDEATFVRAYLDALPRKGTPPDQVRDARELLDALDTSHDERII